MGSTHRTARTRRLVATALTAALLVLLAPFGASSDAATAANRFAWPVSGSVPAGEIAWHRANENGARAVDIAAGIGVTVRAAQSGVVVTRSTGCADSNSRGCGGGFGNYVVVRHDRAGITKPLYTLYAHLAQASVIANGTKVDQGSPLGKIALSGTTTGAHTHFAIGTCKEVWSTGPAAYNSNCTIWNGGETTNATVTAGATIPGNYPDLVGSTPTAPSVAQYAGYLVQWKGENPRVTTWLVGPDLRRTWVPDGGTFLWMQSAGAKGPVPLSTEQLNALSDRRGVRATTDQLGVNWSAKRGTTVRSVTGGYRLVMQTDGNLVVYNSKNKPLWASGTVGRATNVVMQSDGNLVLYNGNAPVWSSRTAGKGRSRVVMQHDGNLVIVAANGKPTWNTETAGGTSRLNNPAGRRL